MPALGECLARSDELGCFTTVAMSHPIKNFQWLPEVSRVINSAFRLLLAICPKPHFPLNFTSSNPSFPLQVTICSSKKKKCSGLREAKTLGCEVRLAWVLNVPELRWFPPRPRKKVTKRIKWGDRSGPSGE